MRKFVTIVVLSLVAATAGAANLRFTTRADHLTLDVVMRRLTHAMASADVDEIKRELKAISEHLTPVYARHGGPVSWWEGKRVKLGSEDELDLICTQHGYANTSTDRGERRKDIMIGFFRWIKQSIWAIVLGMGPVTLLLIGVGVWAYYQLRGRDDEQVALRRKIDELFPDRQKRAELFAEELIARGHKRLKAKGKL